MFLITFAAALAATAFGYLEARSFVRRRLTYVDAVQGMAAPVLAAGAALLVAVPVAGLLPFIGAGTAILFSSGVGFGVAAGARDTRRRRLRA